jgi:hypothetical protein
MDAEDIDSSTEEEEESSNDTVVHGYVKHAMDG